MKKYIAEYSSIKYPTTMRDIIYHISECFDLSIIPNTLTHWLHNQDDLNIINAKPSDETRYKVTLADIDKWFYVLEKNYYKIPVCICIQCQ